MLFNRTKAFISLAWMMILDTESAFSFSTSEQVANVALFSSLVIGRQWFDSFSYDDSFFIRRECKTAACDGTVCNESSHNLAIRWQQRQHLTLCSQNPFMIYTLAEEQTTSIRISLLPFNTQAGYCTRIFLDSPTGFSRFLLAGDHASVDPGNSFHTFNDRDIPLNHLQVNPAPGPVDVDRADASQETPHLQLRFRPDIWPEQNESGCGLLSLDSWQYKTMHGGGKGEGSRTGRTEGGANGESDKQKSTGDKDDTERQSEKGHQKTGGASAGGDEEPPDKPTGKPLKKGGTYAADPVAKKLKLLKKLLAKGKVTELNISYITEQFKRTLQGISGQDINMEFVDGSGFLHDTITNIDAIHQDGIHDLVRALLDNGADLSAPDSQGNTPFHLVASQGLVSVFELLLSYSGDIPVSLEDENMDQHTPLMLATMNGHLDMVILLMTQGTDPLHPTASGYTALHMAARSGDAEMLQALLAHQTPGLVNTPTVSGQTALHLAAHAGHTDAINILAEHGADIGNKDAFGQTAVQLAINNQHVETVSSLLRNGATLSIASASDRIWSKALKNPELLRVILEWNSEHPDLLAGDAATYYVDGDQSYSVLDCKLLYRAVLCKEVESVKVVIAKGKPNLNMRGEKGVPPLQFAVQNNDAAMVLVLLNNGAGINVHSTILHYTALHVAAGHSYKTLVQLLLEQNPDLEAVEREGHTPFSLVAEKLRRYAVNDYGCVERYIPEKNARTYLDILELLADKGANVDHKYSQKSKGALKSLTTCEYIKSSTLQALVEKAKTEKKKKAEKEKAKKSRQKQKKS